MSVEKLELKSPANADIVIEVSGNEFEIVVGMISEEDGARSESIVYLDRSQAHLLMLYLQEKLRNPVPTIEKKLWYCPRCDKYHAENYVCERI